MNTQSRQEFEARIVSRNNGNINGLKAIIAGLGRTAARNNVSIFDCPYKAGSEDAETWMDAYVAEDRVVRFNVSPIKSS